MSRIPLLGGAYRDRSPIASAQETINLYPEKNTNIQAPSPVTHYLTPGSRIFGTPAVLDNSRCLYRTSLGTCYAVVGVNVYFVATNGLFIFVGAIPDRQSQVVMADNGLIVVLVDGVDGFVINMATNNFGQIIDPAFYGADFVVFLDTFFVFNRPSTNQFYISLSTPDYGIMTSSAIISGAITNGGAGYTNGSFSDVPLIGGGGSGATADITVAGGIVTVVTLVEPGINYAVGDTLSVDPLGTPGAGFVWTVTGTADAFDPLDIAAKSGSADPIVGIATAHKELWLIGALTTEVWIGTGAADFYFQLIQGMFIDHGCGAPFSIANADVVIFWLMQDRQGQYQIMKGAAGQVTNIATSWLTDKMEKMINPTDVISGVWAQNNHTFYVVNWITDNLTMMYDLASEEWVRWSWLDGNGNINRYRANTFAFFNGQNIIGDWENGKIYVLDPEIQVDLQNDGDNEGPILRRKTFFHMVGNNFERVSYKNFTADIEVATSDVDDPENPPLINLKFSDDRGKTYGNAIPQTMGLQGQYQTTVTWNRLGQARDRVFMLEWSDPIATSLLGGFAEVKASRS